MIKTVAHPPQGFAMAVMPLTKSLVSMELFLLVGVYSHIPAIHQFCVIASISVFADFFLQVSPTICALSFLTRLRSSSTLRCSVSTSAAWS